MGVLRDFALEFLGSDALTQHVDLVFVKVFNAIDHHGLLCFLQRLVLLVVALLFEELVLFEVGGQLVHFLAQAHLLGIPLVHQALLLIY